MFFRQILLLANNMKRILSRIIIAVILLLVISPVQASAQYFKLELAKPAGSQCGDFQVKVLINTAGVKSINGDALINFEDSKVAVDSATTGSFFTYFNASPLSGTNNKYLVTSWEESIAHSKSASTDTLFATLNLKAKTSGNTKLSFVCDPGDGSGSHINRETDATDILKCSSLATLSFDVSGATCGTSPTAPATASPTPLKNLTPSPGSTPSATPTFVPTSTPKPTSTPIPTNTPNPTSTPRPTVAQLPRAGLIDDTVKALGLGSVLTLLGILFIL